MNIERANLIIDVLQNVAASRRPFDMGSWISCADHIEGEKPACGTSCCAAGWTALDPRAQALGLTLNFAKNSTDETIPVTSASDFQQKWENLSADWICVVMYGGCHGYQAMADFLEISWNEAYELFAPAGYADNSNPQLVIDAIKQKIAEHTAACSQATAG